jgi:hypothetical protein
MRDYSNMPVLDWNSEHAPEKAKAQILRQEPVILQMPKDCEFLLHGDDYDCRVEEENGILYNCNGNKALQYLASQNQLPGLESIAEACAESSSQVDIDSDNKRIIVHD